MAAQSQEELLLDNVNEERPRPQGKLTSYLLRCLIVAALGSTFQFGWALAIFNTPEVVIKGFFNQTNYERNHKYLTNDQLDSLWAITNGLAPLGGIIGGISSGSVADYVGRKKSLLLVNILVIISTVCLAISKWVASYETIMVGRFLMGVYSGFFLSIFSIYSNECSPINVRGLVGIFSQVSCILGIIAANILGLPSLLGTSDLWPVLMSLTVIPVFISSGLFFAVESPKFIYINRNNRDQARSILMKLRNNDERLVENEMNDLEQEQNRIHNQVAWSSFFTRIELRRALIVSVMLQFTQQLSGINAVTFYSTSIFERAGLEWASYATLLMGGVQLTFAFVCLLIVDLAGRKPLLLIGSAGSSVFSFGLVLALVYRNEVDWFKYLTVGCVVFYIVFFSIGPGGIPYLITSELFESDARGKANSIASLSNWVANLAVVVSFPFIQNNLGDHGFIVFGSLLIFFSLFTLIFVPETKNKRIEQVVAGFRSQLIFFPRKL